ncbi:NAD(P)-binding domain-containing protein [Pedosphaera parvula]|uniref:Putative flavin-binding monooxygenase involved in arsenic resistance n=1 Tax=Pedosphaera parvula (strain Ellin514) TaxID=320771 RepID=B9XE08_PEDPL|nr:NAD(P)-binding domain-containing protein [Pedosphaera parvula]EEF61899.1 putative flavin-binding monooxygenase involved in arsenic resistance [Pedosphaera parvula Ellin514]
MQTKRQSHVIIIGAGPAGLGVAACLARKDIPFTLLERGPAILTGLRQVDPAMTLLSPARLSRLPGMELEKGTPTYLRFSDLLSELQCYVQQNNLSVRTDSEVVSIRHGSEGFSVQLRSSAGITESILGSHVINATGIISAPQLPENFNPAECSFRWLHSLETRISHLKSSRRLLVVGGGPSAAEVLNNWLEVRRDEDRTWLSLRSPLVALPHRVFGIDVHYFGWLPEHFPTRFLGNRSITVREPMLGREIPRAINRGRISRVAAVLRYEGSGVIMKDATQLEPDLVVFATGFSYSSSHLGDLVDYNALGQPIARACESTRTRRLYLLGLPRGRTFASHYLRGTARDSEYVAKRIMKDQP